jgi:hypothetical protein
VIILYGSQLYGKVDHVPGLFYVVTTFGHIWYFPLIPTGSYLIIDDGTDENGVQITMSMKSVLMGWMRAFSFVIGAILLIVGVSTMMAPFADPVVTATQLLGGAGLIGLGIVSYYVIGIGRERAAWVAECAGLNPAFVHDHFDQLEGKPPGPSEHSQPDFSQLDEAVKRWNPKL